MTTSPQIALEPATLLTFASSLAALPADEIRKAKSLYLRNAIADYRMQMKTARGFLIVMGVMSLIPVFLVVFIPAFLGFRAARENGKQKILNALEVWKDDLGADYSALSAELDRL
jgi:hypothetical protein